MPTSRIDAERLILLVDDEPDMLSMLKLVIGKKCDCRVITANSGLTALEMLAEERPDVVVSDIKMPDLDGLELLKRIRQHDETISVVIMTGYGTISMAVQALKDGAYDFLQKPFDKDHIIRIVHNCLERTALLRTNQQLTERLKTLALPEGFIGQSQPLRRVLELLSRVADTDATVLIRGESGTGKEVAAKALHKLSSRRKKRMVTVNCPALPEHVLESELFGYKKGAFTGAGEEKKGLFQEADGSTILLDEIADIPVSIQTKLLRVLQEKEIQPLGQNKTIKVDVRVAASTNQDLEAKIAAGEFREDLFYRLNVVSVVMPSLAEIREDVPLLVHHFLEVFTKRYGREGLEITPEVLQQLYDRNWPGNVRELQNSIKRLVLLAGGSSFDSADLNEMLGTPAKEAGETQMAFSDLHGLPYNDAKAEAMKRFSRGYLEQLLSSHRGNITRAAADCGLERQGLQRLLKRYGIEATRYKNTS